MPNIDDPEQLFCCTNFRERLRSNDRDAVKEIALHYTGHLMNHLKMKQNIHLVKSDHWLDIVQSVFVKLLSESLNIDPQRPLLPYLLKTVQNQAIDFKRAEISQKKHVINAGEQRYRSQLQPDPADKLIQKEAISMIEHKIDTMSTRDQDALQITARSSNRNMNKALASNQSITDHTAQMQRQRALKRITDLLKPEEDRA